MVQWWRKQRLKCISVSVVTGQGTHFPFAPEALVQIPLVRAHFGWSGKEYCRNIQQKMWVLGAQGLQVKLWQMWIIPTSKMFFCLFGVFFKASFSLPRLCVCVRISWIISVLRVETKAPIAGHLTNLPNIFRVSLMRRRLQEKVPETTPGRNTERNQTRRRKSRHSGECGYRQLAPITLCSTARSPTVEPGNSLQHQDGIINCSVLLLLPSSAKATPCHHDGPAVEQLWRSSLAAGAGSMSQLPASTSERCETRSGLIGDAARK